jgi:multiple sugar transport system permease protein
MAGVVRRFMSKKLGPLLTTPSFAFLMAISIYPLVYCVFLSFENWNFLKAYLVPTFVGIGNYLDLLHDPIFLNTLIVSTTFTVAAVVLEVVLGIAIGSLFSSRHLRFGKAIRTIMLLPMVVTPVIIGLTWKTLLNLKWGVVNYLLAQLGIQGLGWYTSDTQALPTMVLVDIWQWTPFVALIVFATLLSLPREPFEAAEIDGASTTQVFRHVTIPMLRGSIALAVLIRLIDTLREFDKIYILTRGGPGHATDVFSIFAYRTAFLNGFVSYASAISIVLFIVIVVVCTFLLNRLRSR